MQDRIKGQFYPLTDIEIEEYLCGDAQPADAKKIEAQAASSKELSDYLASRRADQESFFTMHPVLPNQETPRPMLFKYALAAAAVLVLVVAAFFVRHPREPMDSHQQIRAKGAIKTELTVLREKSTFVYRPGVLLREGDRVRLTVESATGGYLSLIGKIGPKQYDIYYNSVKASAGTFTAPNSLILDDHVGSEEWYVVLTPKLQDSSRLIGHIRDQQALEGVVTVIAIEKEAPP